MNYRYCARVLVEAVTPLKIGTGEPGLNIDELVATDANGLPIIPGTALAGVLRHTLRNDFNDDKVNTLFGFQNGNEGEGSRLIISNANFVGQDGLVVDGISDIDFNNNFYSRFQKMAVRDYAKINDKGAADQEKHGKFNTQIVFKGCRFVLDIELIGDVNDGQIWYKLLDTLSSPFFRIGSGTRKGFGGLSVLKIDEKKYNLKKDSNDYMNRSAKLSVPTGNRVINNWQGNHFENYELNLKPEDFFLFSSGYVDRDADVIAKRETYIVWINGKAEFSEEKILIPATSVKGAISHRTAYHYNRLKGNYADKINAAEKIEDYTGENNNAIKEIFGFANNSDINDGYGQRGRAIFSDLFLNNTREKLFNHIAIDRFTGGTIDGALFDEKVIYSDMPIVLKIAVEKNTFREDTKIQEAFECALKDISTGMLPLGGGVMKGYGCFYGSVTRNGEVI